MTKTFTAKSVEEAKALAAAEFGVAEEKISFEIIEEPKKTLFGKTKGDAVVKAEYEASKAEIAASFIKKCIVAMGIAEPSIEIEEIEGGALLELSGEEMNVVIGKKGEVIDSLQYLASLVCNKGEKDYFRITTDCEGFREKRKTQLEALAQKIANNVKRSGRTSALEPMNPYERRIIHAAIAEIEGVTSRSTGEEPYRKVLISSTEKRRPQGRGGRNDRRGGRNDNRNRNRTPKPFDITTSFEKDYKKPKPEDSMDLSTFGKIDI